MIAKRITRKIRTSFKRMAGYVVNEKNGGNGEPTEWVLAEYVSDTKNSGEKVGRIRVTNCESDDPRWAVKEVLATQARNTRATSDLSYHLVVSFPEGETPTPEQIDDIEDEVCRAIGYEAHQRISATHINTDNLHLHIAINRVHPVTLKAIEPFYDYLRLQEACRTLEIKHSLTRENHTPAPEKPLVNGKAADMEAHAKRVSFVRWVKENASKDITEKVPGAKSWREVHDIMLRHGLVIQPRGAGLVVAHHRSDKLRLKASDISRSLSLKKLTDQIGPYEPPEAKRDDPVVEQAREPGDAGRDGGGEGGRPRGEESLPDFGDDPGWSEEVDVGGPADGLAAAKPGKGMIRLYHGGSEADTGGPRWVTPDLAYAEGYARKSGGDVHFVDVPENHPEVVAARDTDAAAGTNMQAPIRHFEASEEIAAQLRPLRIVPEVRLVGPEHEYTGGPIDGSPEDEDLWARYQEVKEGARQQRQSALSTLRSGHLRYTQDLKRWYSERYRNAKRANLNRGDRQATYRVLRDQRMADRHRRIEREKLERNAVKLKHPIPTWDQFLSSEIKRGNEHARRLLERMPDRANSFVSEVGRVHNSVIYEGSAPDGRGQRR